MQTLQPPTVHKQTKQNSYVNTDLSSSSFVFVRHGVIKKPLQPPYDGPFKVLQRTLLWTFEKVVSIDCLKPAYVNTPLVPDALSETLTSHSHLPTSTPLSVPSPIIISITVNCYYSYHQVRMPC